MHVGDTIKTPLTYYPHDTSHKEVFYEVSDSNIIKINRDGTIQGISYGIGYLYVTSFNGEQKDSCQIKVFEKTTGVFVEEAASVKIGETVKLNAMTHPIGRSDNEVYFSSDNNEIAMVDNKGNIKGISKGTTKINVYTPENTYTASCHVNVIQGVESISINKKNTNLNVNTTEQLLVSFLPYNADNKTVIWSSSNTEVASVDENGNIKALKSGETWIKATSEDNPEASDSCKVTVLQPVTGIELDKSEIIMNNIGQTIQLNATVLPEDASNKNVNWKSSNEQVCYVSNGKVVSTGYGTSIVIVTTEDGGHMAFCSVNVEKEALLKGDVNNDKKIDINDVVAIINHMAGTAFYENANVNEDPQGIIDINDVVAIINIMAEK